MSRCFGEDLGSHEVLGIAKWANNFKTSWVFACVVFLSFGLTLLANYVLQLFSDFYFLFSRFVFVFIGVEIPSEIHVFFVRIT
jgi:hypothetical protein